MAESIELYLADLASHPTKRGRRVSPATLRAARADLRGFVHWWEQARTLSFDPTLVIDTDLEDYLVQRQEREGRKPATVNRGNASLRAFFGWAVENGHVRHNPATKLRDVALEEGAPRGLDTDGIDWLVRAANDLSDPLERHRDLALLALLSDCGLRSQEVADLELRDVDLDGGVITVRSGKGRKPRRVLLDLDGKTVDRLRDYLDHCYPTDDAYRVTTELELVESGRVKFLVSRRLAKPGQPWEPGVQTAAMRKRLIALRAAAVAKIEQQAQHEPRLERVGELRELARELASTSPHVLRHGLAYRLYAAGATAKTVARQFGHSREATAMKYGKQKERDIRRVMGVANKRTRPM
jgi:site-specific recombinase XerD